MTKTIEISLNEIHAKSFENNYITRKTDTYHIEGTKSMDILIFSDHGPKNNKIHRYILADIDNLVNLGRHFV